MLKKTVAVTALFVLVILTVRLWPQTTPNAVTTAQPAATTPSPRPADRVPGETAPSPPASSNTVLDGTGGPYSTTATARRAWEPVVEGFATAYPDTRQRSRKQWLADLRPFLDRRLLTALTQTDPDKIPTGHQRGYEILKQAEESLTIRIVYDEGWDLVVYVTAPGHGTWLVDSFDISLDGD